MKDFLFFVPFFYTYLNCHKKLKSNIVFVLYRVALILNKVVLLRTIRVLTSTEVSVHFESVNVLTSVEVRRLC